MSTTVTEILEQVQEPAATEQPITEQKADGAATDGPPKAPQEKVSGKIELLIKREQAALARERQAKEREAQLDARLKAIEERETKINEFETYKKDPKKALGVLGLTYDEITQAHLNDGELPPQVEIQKLRQEIEEFKAAQKQEKDHEKERELNEQKLAKEAEEKKAIDDFKSDIKTYLTDNASRYELIQFEDAEDLVFDVIDEHYNRTVDAETGVGKIMSKAEAADLVEKHFENKYNKAKELNKTKALWGMLPKETKEQLKPDQTPKAPPRTLTNQLSAQGQKPLQNRFLTDQERIQKALAYAKGLRP